MNLTNRMMSINASMAVLAITVLLGITPRLFAAQVQPPYTFSPGTTIKSSEVNSNFQTLAQSMPGVKMVLGSSGVTLSTSAQILATITVTPPADGTLVFFANATVTITQGSTAGGSGWGFSSMKLCTTPTPGTPMSCYGGDGLLTLDTVFASAAGNYAPRLTVPITTMGSASVVKNIPVTYYLTAARDADSVGSCVINSSFLSALFLPGGYLD